jgi:hypothetical protein
VLVVDAFALDVFVGGCSSLSCSIAPTFIASICLCTHHITCAAHDQRVPRSTSPNILECVAIASFENLEAEREAEKEVVVVVGRG